MAKQKGRLDMPPRLQEAKGKTFTKGLVYVDQFCDKAVMCTRTVTVKIDKGELPTFQGVKVFDSRGTQWLGEYAHKWTAEDFHELPPGAVLSIATAD